MAGFGIKQILVRTHHAETRGARLTSALGSEPQEPLAGPRCQGWGTHRCWDPRLQQRWLQGCEQWGLAQGGGRWGN